MPITVTFDIEQASIIDGNDRNRINLCFAKLFWEPVGGTAWRYPALGSNQPEDWFNHVIPALMYFRSMVEHAGLRVYNFTIDAHSEAGHRGYAAMPVGPGILPSFAIGMNPAPDEPLSENRLRQFIRAAADSL